MKITTVADWSDDAISVDQLEPQKFRFPTRNGFFKSVVDDDDDDDDDVVVINTQDAKGKEIRWIEKEISETNSIFGSFGTLNSLTGEIRSFAPYLIW